ncbi:hypothetical protein C4K05_5185 [Pseudomonas chlororaphis subsp. aureofaciens]|uniref:hypothetical protein n=1 Tax=Pseudomonas chlororaphis TaxID=587753 RepID=UPI000F586DFE|nr:hypothetical protein [Pseudomonas chlororaphis]AZE44501.1 hypothetical protein C4K05_5185 [Pseudomonas chlororaphis subsp. aureofaciens]
MIYIKRDPRLIPEKVLKVAERAQTELEGLVPAKRKDFIEKKAHVWRAFGRYLAKMSYGKCWYSESNDPQSFFAVDHFRPKKEARRTTIEQDDGYPWLAFSLENFCYVAGRSNSLNKDEATEKTVGKGSWFPLLDPSKKANWADRCIADERPVLLDPTKPTDVDLVDINPEDGRAVASMVCVGDIKRLRVNKSIELYGLNLGNLISARKRTMREVEDHYLNLMELLAEENDRAAIDRLQEQLKRATRSDALYARAARAKLLSMRGGAYLCAKPEDAPHIA